mmetsp:Transcript_25832/g.43932  ORF Transcript_25832/g.43932 Transcript_25832/m.43932 type:complete len:238 (+) Transcript_25832:311-1024(+)
MHVVSQVKDILVYQSVSCSKDNRQGVVSRAIIDVDPFRIDTGLVVGAFDDGTSGGSTVTNFDLVDSSLWFLLDLGSIVKDLKRDGDKDPKDIPIPTTHAPHKDALACRKALGVVVPTAPHFSRVPYVERMVRHRRRFQCDNVPRGGGHDQIKIVGPVHIVGLHHGLDFFANRIALCTTRTSLHNIHIASHRLDNVKTQRGTTVRRSQGDRFRLKLKRCSVSLKIAWPVALVFVQVNQ